MGAPRSSNSQRPAGGGSDGGCGVILLWTAPKPLIPCEAFCLEDVILMILIEALQRGMIDVVCRRSPRARRDLSEWSGPAGMSRLSGEYSIPHHRERP